MISVFPAWSIIPYLKYPSNRTLMKESIAISDTLLHLRILKVFTSCYWGKEVLDKVILVLDFFSQKFCMTMQLQTVMISAGFFSVGFGFPIVRGIPDSLNCTPDSKAQVSGFQSPGFGIPQQNFPDYGIRIPFPGAK